MNDLRVLFFAAAEDTGYRAQLADAGGTALGVEVPFTPFLAESDYEDLRWYLEEYMDLPDGGAVIRAQRIERELEQWGSQLYDALFTAAENRALLSRLLAGPEPRRLTIGTRDPGCCGCRGSSWPMRRGASRSGCRCVGSWRLPRRPRRARLSSRCASSTSSAVRPMRASSIHGSRRRRSSRPAPFHLTASETKNVPPRLRPRQGRLHRHRGPAEPCGPPLPRKGL